MAPGLAHAAAGKGPKGLSPLARRAQAEIDPTIAALTAAAQRRARASEAAIHGFTQSYANELGGLNIGSPYAGAEAGQAAIDSALQQSLAGKGSDLASALAARLSALQGSTGAGAVDAASGGLASQGTASGNTALAHGSAALSNLLAQAAGAETFGQKLPGIADLSGLQGIKQAEGQANTAIDQGTLAAESRLPDIMQQLRSDQLSRQSLASQNAYRAGQLQQGQERLAIEQQNANTAAARADAYSRQLERAYGLDLAKFQLAAQSARQARSGLTPDQIAQERTKAAAALQTFYDGVPAKYQIGPNGQRVLVSGTGPGSQKTYQQAIKSLMLSYPALGPKQVIQMANKLYAPGEGGRPTDPKIAPDYLMKKYGLGPAGAPFAASIGGSKGVVSAVGQSIVSMAQHFVGTPYVWGGESPKGFDCSGFAQYLYSHAGISIPRTTYTQWTAPNGHAVPMSQLLPGDLVFYKGGDSIIENGRVLPGHVGIYIGHGKIINAYGTGYGVRVDNVNMPGYMGARRFK